MADYINLQQAEFAELQTKLKALHDELIREDVLIRQSILELVSMEGGFYVSSISEKIQGLLQELQSGPMSQLRECFDGTEMGIEAFIQGIIEVDTAYV